MKKCLLTLFLFASLFSNAQSWSPAGATWYYSMYVFAPVTGYVKIEYDGDTLIGTGLWKKLEKYYIGYNHGNSTYFNYHAGTLYTREADSVVYLYDTASATADTLFNFKAVTGDQWGILPHFTGNCNEGYVKVLNTGINNINGQNLKWLYLELDFTDDAYPPYNDTLYQKIGPKGFFGMNDICSNALDANEGGPLRCYSDAVFGTYNISGQPCDLILSVTDEKENAWSLNVYPNPVSGQYITIDQVKQSIPFVLTDIKGKTIQTGTFHPGHNTVYTGHLSSGLYILFAGEGRVPYKLVKQ